MTSWNDKLALIDICVQTFYTAKHYPAGISDNCFINYNF